MTINRLLAQMTVSDLDRAVSWYTRFFGREPDARPMDGLVEWHLHNAFGIQVWLDPKRAGRSTMVLEESDLNGRVAELDAEGLPYEGPQTVTVSRVVQLDDPDGNRIVMSGD
jgi:catechol 2,3-dioxygenase-like lactoylglutathione lyase family enzyme